MQKFEGISFVWALIMVGALATIYGLRAFIGYRNVARDAEDDYTYKLSQNMVDPRLSKDGYIRAYKRFHNPRGLAFIAGGLGAILALTAPALLLIQIALHQLWKWTDESRVFEPGFLVWQFSIFFSLIGIWAGIAYITARIFHKNTPLTLRDEMMKEKDN